jgi:xanthine dehydrogenase accessory factor
MSIILIQGGGDLASGVALRLHRSGYQVLISELPQPLSVRRAVSFSEAVYEGQVTVEDVTASLVKTPAEIQSLFTQAKIPVLIAPELQFSTLGLQLAAIIDARLLKKRLPHCELELFPLKIGLGPGFIAGENCHAAIETNRGHRLGRVYWTGATEADTGQPEGDPRRVLRAPTDGVLTGCAEIGDHVEPGQTVAEIGGQAICAPFGGVVRGLIRPGLEVGKNLKIGDIDPRDVREYCFLASDKSLSIGGAVLEALLGYETRQHGR